MDTLRNGEKATPLFVVGESSVGMIDLNEWNDRILAEFRTKDGRVRWSDADDLAAGRPIPPPLPGFDESGGPPIILVHSVGARTGQERVNPTMYRPLGDDFAVFATYGGSPRHPAWFHNLIAHPMTRVEAGSETIPVIARVAAGDERQRIWSQQIQDMPAFADFEANSGRQVPVVILERDR